MNSIPFPHLHLHNEYSLLDSPLKLNALIDFAEEKGVKCLATTNHGNADDSVKLTQKCQEKGIHPIIGAELYIIHDGLEQKKRERRHLVVLVKEEKGFKNLMSMLTEANLSHFYYKPQIPLSFLYKHLEGLVVLSACSGGVLSWPDGEEVCANLLDLKGEDFYLEAMPFEEATFRQYFKKVSAVSDKLGIPLVATNDVHYLEPEGWQLHQVLINIGAKRRLKDPNRRVYDVKDLYFKTEKEMRMGFKEQDIFSRQQVNSAIENAYKIAESCKFVLQPTEPALPIIGVPEGSTPYKQFKKLCWEGLKERGLEEKSDYRKRLEHEIEQIHHSKKGFSTYFLIVHNLQKWAKKEANMLTSPCRGSVGGSLAAYALGITEVDPLKYDLIFERFVSPGRIDFPDIDLDFEDGRREEVHDYLRQTYGSDSVAHVSTFGRMKAKGALRDVSRYFDVPLADVSLATKAVLQRTGGDSRENFSLSDSMATFERAKDFKKRHPKVAEHAVSLEGNLRNLGVHAAGIVLSPQPLEDTGRCYLRQTSKGLAVNWDDKDLEYMGFVKFDILGLSALSILAEAGREIGKKTGQEVDFYSMELDDKKVLDSFSRGDTTGIFQLGSLGMRKIIQELEISNFEDVVAMNALHRPGALRTSVVTDYIDRKHGRQAIKKVNPIFDRLTTDTYGLVLYQEQIMYLLNEMAGLPWKTADTVRKVISKSQGVEKFMSFQKQFVEGCVKKGTMGRREAEKMFGELRNYGSYGFNRSHSTGYSLLAYYEAWCKVHHPGEFFVALINHSSEAEIEEYVEDCRKKKLEVKLPSVHSSGLKWRLDEGVIWCGLESIKGLSNIVAHRIVGSRPYPDMASFSKKVGKISKRDMEVLLASRAFRPWKTEKVLQQINDFEQLSFFKNSEVKEEKIRRLSLEPDAVLPFREESDLSFRNRRLILALSDGLHFRNIREIDFSQPSKKQEFFCGKMREVKFGYREKVARVGMAQTRGTADSWGGVYGNFEDESTFIMVVFAPDLYRTKKRMIEELEGDDILILANHHQAKSNLFIKGVWRLSDIRQGVFDDLNSLGLIEGTKVSFGGYLSGCQRCSLHSSCKQPVQIESGQSNLMIVGEAPGREEDKENRPFVGRTGKLLFNELKKLNFEREDFYLSNTVKCYPKGVKPLEQVSVCGEYLEMEIHKVKPIVILSLGNIPRFFFTQKKTGIIEANAQVEWNDRFQAWIVYSIHPALLLHQPGNERLLEESLGAFKNLVRQLV